MPEGGFGAVAVMDVEIDDGDAPGPVRRARMQRRDRGAVEQAEPHGAFRLGVMAGRARRDEGVLRLTGVQRIHRRAGAACSAQACFERMRAGEGVGVELREAVRRRILFDEFAEPCGMNQLHLIGARAWRNAAFKRGEVLFRQHLFNCGVAAGMLHMAGRDFMGAERSVGV